MTAAQPAANAGAILRVIIADISLAQWTIIELFLWEYLPAGKFHGVIIPHTPTGSLKVSTVVCGVDDGIVSP
jgi:hypothetical protein